MLGINVIIPVFSSLHHHDMSSGPFVDYLGLYVAAMLLLLSPYFLIFSFEQPSGLNLISIETAQDAGATTPAVNSVIIHFQITINSRLIS